MKGFHECFHVWWWAKSFLWKSNQFAPQWAISSLSVYSLSSLDEAWDVSSHPLSLFLAEEVASLLRACYHECPKIKPSEFLLQFPPPARFFFFVATTTETWQKIEPAIIKSLLISLHCSNGNYPLQWEIMCGGFLHVQSSHRGSFRKAGVFFRKETVRVTSSPAFLKTWTCGVKTLDYF